MGTLHVGGGRGRWIFTSAQRKRTETDRYKLSTDKQKRNGNRAQTKTVLWLVAVYLSCWALILLHSLQTSFLDWLVNSETVYSNGFTVRFSWLVISKPSIRVPKEKTFIAGWVFRYLQLLESKFSFHFKYHKNGS